ncbi:hypothetical protein [Nonomuraea composti]|uniref:hypothetical protein n=1 Tax=Nonomuraea composti TaxID=2720023 RepID=UPI001F117331|nr:hypothetical protein [Nonomuraea sp. FMUSA5-5]
MSKTRHKNPRTAMRYVKPGAEAIVKATEVLAPPLPHSLIHQVPVRQADMAMS